MRKIRRGAGGRSRGRARPLPHPPGPVRQRPEPERPGDAGAGTVRKKDPRGDPEGGGRRGPEGGSRRGLLPVQPRGGDRRTPAGGGGDDLVFRRVRVPPLPVRPARSPEERRGPWRSVAPQASSVRKEPRGRSDGSAGSAGRSPGEGSTSSSA